VERAFSLFARLNSCNSISSFLLTASKYFPF
jgi:hypothetical protein